MNSPRYTGDTNAALQHFNRCRKDSHWSERAIYAIIDICMHPDNEIIGGEVFETSESGATGDGANSG